MKHDTYSEYVTQFKAIVATIKQYKGNIGNDTILVHNKIVRNGIELNESIHIPGNEVYNDHIKYAKTRACVLSSIDGVDRGRYDQLHIDMINSFNRGQEIYPTSLTKAYKMIVNYIEPTKPKHAQQVAASRK